MLPVRSIAVVSMFTYIHQSRVAVPMYTSISPAGRTDDVPQEDSAGGPITQPHSPETLLSRPLQSRGC